MNQAWLVWLRHRWRSGPAVGPALLGLALGIACVSDRRWLGGVAALLSLGVAAWGVGVAPRIGRTTARLGAWVVLGACMAWLRWPAPLAVPGVDRPCLTGTLAWAVSATPPLHRALLHTPWGTVRVSATRPLPAGAEVRVCGKLRAARGMVNPGGFDTERWAWAQGYASELFASEVVVRRSPTGALTSVRRWLARTRTRWSQRLGEVAPEPAALLRGMVLGERGALSDPAEQAWRAAGVVHVLSVSGLHLMLVAWLVLALGRRLCAASPLGRRLDPLRLVAPLALGMALAYTELTGSQIATWRAWLALAFLLWARVRARRLTPLRGWRLVALVHLLWWPWALFDLSLQLALVATLVLVSPRCPNVGQNSARWRRALGRVGHGLRVSLWLVVATAPLSAAAFQQVTVTGMLGNLLIVPLLELGALPLTLASLLVGELWPALGAWGLAAAAACVDLAHALAQWLGALPGTWTVAWAKPTLALPIALLSAGLFGWRAWRWGSRGQRRLVMVLGSGLVAAAWVGRLTPRPADAVRVTFFDVGQGDAALLEFPSGRTWLVDAGGWPGSPQATLPGDALVRALRAYGVDRLDVVVLSHPHPDHYLGLASLLPQFAIAELWLADGALWDAPEASVGPAARDAPAAPSLRVLVEALQRQGTRVLAPPLGVAYVEPAAVVEVLAPRLAPHAQAHGDPVRSVNDNSLVVRLTVGQAAVLFLGDVEAEGEAQLLREGVGPRVTTVLKLAHHGSRTSSTPALLEALRPALVVISCGSGNRFGFPHPEVLARLGRSAARVLRTDIHGALTLRLDPNGAPIQISAERDWRLGQPAR